MKKLKIAQYSLSGCEGCTFTLLLTILNDPILRTSLDVVTSKTLGYVKPMEAEVSFIDGSIITPDDVKLARLVRKKSKIVVALGSCAHIGGVPALGTNIDPLKAIQLVYVQKPRIIKVEGVFSLGDIVKVDYVIPGCPPSQRELRRFILDILLGKEFRLPDKPVCFECRGLGIKCILEEGIVCLGSITRAGCNAICLSFGVPCWGCRGPLDELRIEQFLDAARKHNIDLKEVREKVHIFMAKTKIPLLLKEEVE